MRAKLIFACLALGGLMRCAASNNVDPARAISMASNDPIVGQQFWTTIPKDAGSVPDIIKIDVKLPVGTHFKVDGIDQGVNIVNGNRYPSDLFYYRMILDDGRTVYMSTSIMKIGLSATPPENLTKVSDREIVVRIIEQSRQSYEGQCACPDDRSYGGRACGGRSAYSRKRGIKCYPADVSKTDIAEYRAEPHFK